MASIDLNCDMGESFGPWHWGSSGYLKTSFNRFRISLHSRDVF
ncbi:hypothetical protein SAMN05414139_07484 [Burkholderia sp. D7]|nr:hypothetical protein SAMN05414139_07484 [Burkholderia sp. D7]